MSEYSIICGQCGAPVEGSENPRNEDLSRCPNCGQEDTFRAVMTSVTDFTTAQMQNYLNDGLSRAVRGSKTVKFAPGKRPKSQFRWKVDGLKF